MLEALRSKFANGRIMELLLSTDEAKLIHKAAWDSYWGTGRNGKGKNRLGHLLMQVRTELLHGY